MKADKLEGAELMKLLLKLEDFFVSGRVNKVDIANDRIPDCWTMTGCRKKRCPAYGLRGARCWQINGTFCKPGIKRPDIAKKWDDCRRCPVFLKATSTKKARMAELISNIFFSLTGRRDAEKLERTRAAVSKAGEVFDLTARENQILPYLADRRSRKQIAEAFCVSEETVKYHIKNIYRKMKISSRDGLDSKLQNPASSSISAVARSPRP